MKIVILMHSYFEIFRGGAEYQAWLIAHGLLKKNHEIHFIFLANPGDELRLNEKSPFQFHPIYKTKLKEFLRLKLAYLPEVFTRLSDIRPDIIYHRNLSSFLYAATLYSRMNQAKIILHIAHDNDVKRFRLNFKGRGFYRNIDDFFKFKSFHHVDAFISQTYDQQSELYNNYKWCSSVVRNIAPELPNVDLGLKENIIIWIANIKPIKNPFPFIELAKALSMKGYRFVMVGRPSTDSFHEMFLARLCNSNVEYLGELSRTDVDRLLCRAKILCCTSFSEGFSNTFLEAWTRKVPVVSLHVDPDRLLSKEGLGVKAKSFNAFVESVDTLMQNDTKREAIGENASRYVALNHSATHAVEKIHDIIRTL